MAQVVILDACVLYPAPLRDLLMWAATKKLFSVRWSRDIMNEWVENLLVNRPDLKRERLERTCAEMNRAVPDALVAGYDELIPTMLLRDLDDRHVVAAAIIGDAETILTFNLKDFPTQDLPVGIQAASPDDYLSRMFDSQPEAFVATMAEHRASLTRPPKSAIDYLETLQACGLVELTERASQHMEKL